LQGHGPLLILTLDADPRPSETLESAGEVAKSPGATVATTGILLPAFVFVAASAPVIPRLRRSLWWPTSTALMLRFRVNSAWLVLGGAVIGWIVKARS
jgi:hypothetical protein